MRRTVVAVIAAAASLLVWVTAASGGAFVAKHAVMYVDGVQYRTVDTPAFYNDKAAGAPDHTWDNLYLFPADAEFSTFSQLHLADAAPGDRDYNGGRWIVHAVSFTTSYHAAAMAYGGANHVFDHDAELQAAITAGAATALEIFRFECPVLKLNKNA